MFLNVMVTFIGKGLTFFAVTNSLFMKFLFTTLLLCFSSICLSQEVGSIAGSLTDKEANNSPLPFANVLIKNSSKGTTSDFDGLYRIENLEPGTYTVVFSFVGYETIEVPNVTVVAGKVTEINTALGSSAAALDEVIITTVARRDSEVALLLDQKKAVEMKQSIGAQELSRKGVSDASSAVTKTSGIAKQEGSSNIYVRGLDDRYNSTSLNNLPIPSNNSLRKNIDLSIFATDIIEAIDIDKTYVTTNYGDFGGASINIDSKEYTGNGFFEIDLGTGINTNAINTDEFKQHDGPKYLGFSNPKMPNNPLDAYNFTTSWETQSKTPIASSYGLTGGKSFNIGNESKLSFFLHGSFNNNFSYKEGVERGSVSKQAIARKDLTFESYDYTTGTTGIANLTYKVNNNHKISYNGLYINSTSQQHNEYRGVLDIFDQAANGGGYIRRSIFERTQLFVNQLIGTHTLTDQIDVNWGATYNQMRNDMPDRMQNTLRPVDDNNLEVLTLSELSDANNHRYFHELNEDEYAARIAADYKFSKNSEDEYAGKITLGYQVKTKDIHFNASQYNFALPTGKDNPNVVVDPYHLDSFFNQESLDNGNIQGIKTLFGGSFDRPEKYNGTQIINAGYVNFQYQFNKLTLLAGLRGEKITQKIDWLTAVSPMGGEETLDETQILPSLSLKYELNEKNNLRFAASKTYTLPQFIERAKFQYVNVTYPTIGNPDLYSSTNYNVDLRWEFFPKNDELISVTAFGKLIQDPINEFVIASATNDISWANTGDLAKGVGIELEARKNLLKKELDDTRIQKLALGGNISYLYTEQDLDSEKVGKETSYSVRFTDSTSPLTGASDWLINADLSYSHDFSEKSNLLLTLAGNYFSDRFYAIGTNNQGGIYDKAVFSMDFIAKYQINKNLGIGLSAKNLTNPTIERYQDEQDVVVKSYDLGQSFSLSLNYKF